MNTNDGLEVEIPNRGRSGSALVGPMRRSLHDILISTRFGYVICVLFAR